MKSLKKEFEKFKDKVVDNYEYWFASFILEDISEIGGFETLIDEQYEFLFNVDLSDKLQHIIVNNIKDFDTKELIIDFIKLKRITDKRILESNAYDADFVNEYISNIKIQNKLDIHNSKTPIELNSRLINKDQVLQLIFNFLNEKEYIESSLKDFKDHFDKAEWKEITWIGKQIELAAFISCLFNYDLISQNKERGNKVPLVMQHFYNKSGQSFKKNSLAKEFSTFKLDDSLCPEIGIFFRELNQSNKIKFS